MATSSLSRHTLPGALGDVFVDVRAGGRQAPRPAVVIVHGFKGFKDWGMFPPLADRIARAGFSVVSFNMSGSGVDASGEPTLPDRFARNTYSAELADLGVVIDALAAGGLGVAAPTAIGVVGHSRGGGIAVLATARDRRIRSLVTLAAIANVVRWDARQRREWRQRGHIDVVNGRTGQVIPLSTDVLDEIESGAPALDIAAAAGRIDIPWLIVHGGADEAVDPDDASLLAKSSGRAATTLLMLPGAGHTFGAVHPWNPTPRGAISRVFDETVRWLATTLA